MVSVLNRKSRSARRRRTRPPGDPATTGGASDHAQATPTLPARPPRAFPGARGIGAGAHELRSVRIEPGSFHFALSSDQAAAHADWTTSFDFKHAPATGRRTTMCVRSWRNLPGSFDASNTAMPRCPLCGPARLGQLAIVASPRPSATQLGVDQLRTLYGDWDRVGRRSSPIPLYNMEATSYGVDRGARLQDGGRSRRLLQVSVRPSDDGLTITTPDIPKAGEFVTSR